METSYAQTWVPMPLCQGRISMSLWLRASQESFIHLVGQLDPLQLWACPQQPLAGTQVCLLTCARVLHTHPCKQHPPPIPSVLPVGCGCVTPREGAK